MGILSETKIIGIKQQQTNKYKIKLGIDKNGEAIHSRWQKMKTLLKRKSLHP